MKKMTQTMRWFGPDDPVSLRDIRQAGCSGVVTALHHIPVGDVWTVEDIRQRKRLIEAAGLEWKVIESLPVHENIKKRSENFQELIARYKISLQNLAAEGLEVVTYNFMPILDWMRTDTAYEMPDGSKALYFERLAFIAFDLFILCREDAASDYTADEQQRAEARYNAMSTAEKEELYRVTLLGLPGSKDRFTEEEIRNALKTYSGISAARLKEHLFAFLNEIVPTANDLGLKMAIHPDDPPYPILGLPRIVSTMQDLREIIEACPLPANGLCFCTGSLGARSDNNIPEMLQAFGDHIHFLHLRNTKSDAAGNFYEADHLAGDTDMPKVVEAVLKLMQRRGISIPMRPDHGHQMLDDLNKKTYPGYSAIGRLRGLAELRGLELGIARMLES